MAYDVQSVEPVSRSASEPSMTSLVAGIIADVQRLLEQQLALFRRELQDDANKVLEAVSYLAIGGAIALVAGICGALALAQLLVWAIPNLPEWGGLAIVAGALAVIGFALVYAAYQKFGSFNPLPDESAQALKENVACILKTPR